MELEKCKKKSQFSEYINFLNGIQIKKFSFLAGTFSYLIRNWKAVMESLAKNSDIGVHLHNLVRLSRQSGEGAGTRCMKTRHTST